MKKFGWILALLFVPLVALAQDTEEIISLSNSGVSTDVMIAFVENSESSFQLTAEDIRRLREAKVPDAVIVKMLRHRGAGENTIITRNGVVAREPQRIVTRERVVEVPERTVVYTSPTYVSPVVYAGYYSYPRYYSSYCAPRYYPPYCPPRYYSSYCGPRYYGGYYGGYCGSRYYGGGYRSGFSFGFRGRF